jgi:hypothetical protein
MYSALWICIVLQAIHIMCYSRVTFVCKDTNVRSQMVWFGHLVLKLNIFNGRKNAVTSCQTTQQFQHDHMPIHFHDSCYRSFNGSAYQYQTFVYVQTTITLITVLTVVMIARGLHELSYCLQALCSGGVAKYLELISSQIWLWPFLYIQDDWYCVTPQTSDFYPRIHGRDAVSRIMQ